MSGLVTHSISMCANAYTIELPPQKVKSNFIKSTNAFNSVDNLYMMCNTVRMGTITESIITFLKELMERRGVSASRLASDLGLSHATVSRWLSGKDIPSPRSCQKLAEQSGVPLVRVLSIAGYMPSLPNWDEAELPEFREYVRKKYSREIDEDLIIMIEDLIERRRKRNERSRRRKRTSAHSS